MREKGEPTAALQTFEIFAWREDFVGRTPTSGSSDVGVRPTSVAGEARTKREWFSAVAVHPKAAACIRRGKTRQHEFSAPRN
jgi:hypothetical protein